MTDPKDIPFLIELLDDECHEVRYKVRSELASFGPLLKDAVDKFPRQLNNIQLESISSILAQQKRINLKRSWRRWLYRSNDYEKLECGLTILSEFLSENDAQPSLGVLLDELAQEYKQAYRFYDVYLLSRFLFRERLLKGNEKDYYNPLNSNLSYVICSKKGIPISLVSIYMLVGYRLGLAIEGCHFPGHFLARINEGRRKVFIDCFNRGHIIEEKDVFRMRKDLTVDVESILNEHVSAEVMMRRFLANLIRSYQIRNNQVLSDLMMDLFRDLDAQISRQDMISVTPEDIINKIAFYESGLIVRHRRYGYRGIVVDVDSCCYATDQWYYGNQTQPEREQPWYHILVHGSDQVTYVAQSNLRVDNTSAKIDHPLLSYFFTESREGKYSRNENPWPDTDY